MKFKTLVRGVVFSLFTITLVLPSFGQEQDNKKRFRCLAWNTFLDTVFMTQSDLPPPPTPDNPTPTPDPNFKEEHLLIPTATRSSFYKIDPTKPVKFIQHNGNKIVLLGTVDLSSGPTLPLLFFLPGKDPNTYNIQVIDDDPNNFPGGSFLCFNWSKSAVIPTFKNSVGTLSATIQPSESKLLKPNFSDGIVTGIIVNLPNVAQPIYMSAWTLNRQVRYLIFFVDDPSRSGSVIFLRVPDDLKSLVEPTQAP